MVSTPPASATAWKMTPYSGQFGAITATTSPFASPLSNQPPACRRTASSNSPYVIFRPVAAVDEGGLAGELAGAFQRVRRQRQRGKLTDGNGLVKVIFPAPS